MLCWCSAMCTSWLLLFYNNIFFRNVAEISSFKLTDHLNRNALETRSACMRGGFAHQTPSCCRGQRGRRSARFSPAGTRRCGRLRWWWTRIPGRSSSAPCGTSRPSVGWGLQWSPTHLPYLQTNKVSVRTGFVLFCFLEKLIPPTGRKGQQGGI